MLLGRSCGKLNTSLGGWINDARILWHTKRYLATMFRGLYLAFVI